MSMPELVRPKFISLRGHPALDERWLHQRLQDDPSLLGLGDLQAIDSERRQPSGGRLDLLLREPESLARYEVEIQLGATDETHLVRTIEYWDIERRRYPQYEHTAVIVAEDITSRFLNVISLFNGSIPLIAIQLKGVEVNGAFTLIATKVLDVIPLGTDEEDEGEVFDKDSWERKSSPGTLSLVDSLVEMIRKVAPGIGPKFNKHHIGLAMPGSAAQNFVTFHPRKAHLIVGFRIAQEDELSSRLGESNFHLLPYDKRWGYYRIRVTQPDLEDKERCETIDELIAMAHAAYPSNR